MNVLRQTALVLLTEHAETLTPKAGQFLGQIAVSANLLTDRQSEWLATLLQRAGLPPLIDGGER